MLCVAVHKLNCPSFRDILKDFGRFLKKKNKKSLNVVIHNIEKKKQNFLGLDFVRTYV